MIYEPPFGLDPYQAIRDPDSLPALMVRAMHKLIPKQRGNPEEKLVSAFNIAAWTLTTAGRKKQGTKSWRNEGSEARLIEGTLKAKSERLEEEAKRKPDTDRKLADIKRLAGQIYRRNQARYDKTWWAANNRERPGS